MAAAVVIGSLNICSHLDDGRLLLINRLVRSYRSAINVNNTSISSRLCCTYQISSMINTEKCPRFFSISSNRSSRLAATNVGLVSHKGRNTRSTRTSPIRCPTLLVTSSSPSPACRKLTHSPLASRTPRSEVAAFDVVLPSGTRDGHRSLSGPA